MFFFGSASAGFDSLSHQSATAEAGILNVTQILILDSQEVLSEYEVRSSVRFELVNFCTEHVINSTSLIVSVLRMWDSIIILSRYNSNQIKKIKWKSSKSLMPEETNQCRSP